jgi:drug/metabolite transporter (DMT)-like permease
MRNVYLLLAATTLIAGLTPIAARMATAELPPLTLAFFRFGAAGVLLVLTAKALGLRWSITPANRRLIIGLGVLCVPINQFGFLVGIKLANASHAAIAYALVPVLVYWISLLLGRTPLTLRMGLASAIAFAGAAVVDLSTTQAISRPASFGLGVFVGDLLLLSAALSWSLFAVLSQPLVKELGAVQTLTSVFLIGTLWQIPLVAADALWFDLSTFQLASVTWQGWAGFAFITLVTAYLNYLLWYLVTARYDITRSSVVTNTHFLITVIIEASWFQQRLSGWVAVGSALLLLGIILATSKPDAQAATERTRAKDGAATYGRR